MNSKVNNWAIKVKSYNPKFEYTQGIQNTLADTLSRLIEIDPDVTLPAEPLVGMKRDIQQHCKRCRLCVKHNIAKVKFEKTHFKGARQSIWFISMDLIGEFYPPS